jgi:hypothetical protein
MRTTLSIHDTLLHKAKEVSAQRNVSVGELVEEGLRVTLAARSKTGRGAVRPLKTFRGEGVQPGEATEPSIKRDPITTPLKSQSRMVSVRHQVAARVGSLTKIDKNFPVIGTRRKNMHFGARAQVFHKIQRRGQRCGLAEDFGVRDDA